MATVGGVVREDSMRRNRNGDTDREATEVASRPVFRPISDFASPQKARVVAPDRSRRLSAGGFRATWCLFQVLLWVASGMSGGRSAMAGSEPRILEIRQLETEWRIRVGVPGGTARVWLEGCRRSDLRGWIPRALARLGPLESETSFRLPADPFMEMFRVRADATDPVPPDWYSGMTDFPPEPVTAAWGGVRDCEGAPGANGEYDPNLLSEVLGDTLYVFQERRGLQLVDLGRSGIPVLKASRPLAATGVRMHVTDTGRWLVLGHSPCDLVGQEPGAFLWEFDTTGGVLSEVGRRSLKGRLVASHWDGRTLCVATESWEPVEEPGGAWQRGTRLTTFDGSVSGAVRSGGSRWLPGPADLVKIEAGRVFVASMDTAVPWPWKTRLEVLWVDAGDASLVPIGRTTLAGRIRERDGWDLWEDRLRVVLEGLDAPSGGRRVTSLETYGLPETPGGDAGSLPRLDRLELARGEGISSVHWDGSRAYVVSGNPADPIWRLELTDPENLRMAGEVEVPGRSTLLRPMGERLLTLGAGEVGGGALALRWFDVTESGPAKLLATVPWGDEGVSAGDPPDATRLGVWGAAGLVLLSSPGPVGDGTLGGGVELLDVGRESLSKRGRLPAPGLVPGSVVLHRDRLVALSENSLETYQIGDRDQPLPMGSVALGHPVDRVLWVGEHRLEFDAGTIRVRSGTGPGVDAEWWVGALPVLGAEARGGRLYLLQGSGAEVTWIWDGGTGGWLREVRPGTRRMTIWDVGSLPAMTPLGEARWSVERGGTEVADALWIRDDLLVWACRATESEATTAAGGWPALVARAGAAVGAGGTDGRVAGNLRWSLLAVDVAKADAPRLRSETVLGDDGVAVGRICRVGARIMASREILESEEMGNLAVDAWLGFSRAPLGGEESVEMGEGKVRTRVWATNEGDWRPMTNGYPVLRSRFGHVLDVVDFAGGADAPVVRTPVSLPGSLMAVMVDGEVLITAGWRTGVDGRRGVWLESCAYDGLRVYGLDAVRVKGGRSGGRFPMEEREGVVYVAAGAEGEDEVDGGPGRIDAWRLGERGRWERGAGLDLDWIPEELEFFGNLLLARRRGRVVLLGTEDGASWVVRWAGPLPGCCGQGTSLGDGDSVHGVWLPLGEFGAFLCGEEGVSTSFLGR